MTIAICLQLQKSCKLTVDYVRVGVVDLSTPVAETVMVR